MPYLPLLLFIFSLSALAAREDSSSFRCSLGASADLQGQYFPQPLSPQVGQSFGVFNAELLGSVKSGKTFLVKLRPTGHLDPRNPSSNERSWYDLPEGYAQIKGNLGEGNGATLQLGYNTFTWGVTDGYNPIDVVSARRYSDPLSAQKLGAFSALGRLDLGWALLEGIYIPWQRSSTLPGDHSRWLPREFAGQVRQSGILFDPPEVPVYTFAASRTSDNALHNNAGGRISSHFLGIDGALYYFDGASSVPGIASHLDGDVVHLQGLTILEIAATPLITLTPLYHRIKIGGASAVFNVWELVVRGELAVTDAYRKGSSSFAEHSTESVLELEHTFSGEKSTLTAIALVSLADHRYGDSSTTSTPSLTNLFDRASGLGLRWQPTEAVGGEAFAVFDTKQGGELYKMNLTYQMSDNWKVYAGGEVFRGKSSQPIGAYHQNGRAIAGLKLSL